MNNYEDVFNKFLKSTTNDILYNIKLLKPFVKHIDINNINILINEINNKLSIYINDKDIYSSLKILYINCNSLILSNSTNILNIITKTKNINKILYYVRKIENIEIFNAMHTILYDDTVSKKNYMKIILNLINQYIQQTQQTKQKPYNTLEEVLYKTNPNIYANTYFLQNENKIYDNKEKILKFIVDLGYYKKNFEEIDKLNLKRGFIQGLINNKNKKYLLKYQPNKSIMELVLNSYVKKLNSPYFLLPKLFFINHDNSYFYIIEKYNTDLYKFFNILLEKKKILTLKQIINISSFILKSIKILHKNSIIHSDLKLENIVININISDIVEITDIKIIDFDVGLFDIVPQSLLNISEKYDKIFNNKKNRGTRIYMLKDKIMSFKNDIYSLGVISLVLLYKNIKVLIAIQKKSKKKTLIMKKLNELRDVIEVDENKINILNIITEYFNNSKNDSLNFFDDIYNYKMLKKYKDFIVDCIKNQKDSEWSDLFLSSASPSAASPSSPASSPAP